MLVVDASFTVELLLSRTGRWPGDELVGPALLWAEAGSTVHALKWRRQISERAAGLARERLRGAPIALLDPPTLWEQAWDVADQLGWARTYDAHYVALAIHQGCPLLTIDGRLQRGAKSMVTVLGPNDVYES